MGLAASTRPVSTDQIADIYFCWYAHRLPRKEVFLLIFCKSRIHVCFYLAPDVLIWFHNSDEGCYPLSKASLLAGMTLSPSSFIIQHLVEWTLIIGSAEDSSCHIGFCLFAEWILFTVSMNLLQHWFSKQLFRRLCPNPFVRSWKKAC